MITVLSVVLGGNESFNVPCLNAFVTSWALVNARYAPRFTCFSGKAFVVRIRKTAKPMEVQAIHNLKKLGYVVEAG